MTPESPAATPAFIPTIPPLPAGDIHPDELKVILAEAAERHAEAVAALAAAQDHFDAAERRREYALSEEAKGREREEQAQVEALRGLYPAVVDDIDRLRRMFYDACSEISVDISWVMEVFTRWAQKRAAANEIKQIVLRYDSAQSRDTYIAWLRRIAGWNELIRSVTSWRKGGALNGEDDDLDGLAAVNLRINAESQDALRPLTRDPADQSTPRIEDIGFRDPAIAGMDQMFTGSFPALEFNTEFSRAVAEGASSLARQVVRDVRDTASRELESADKARTEVR